MRFDIADALCAFLLVMTVVSAGAVVFAAIAEQYGIAAIAGAVSTACVTLLGGLTDE